MLAFLIDNFYVGYENRVFKQSVGIPIAINFAPLLADLFLYSYEVEFIQRHGNLKSLVEPFNSTLRRIDDILSINNSNI